MSKPETTEPTSFDSFGLDDRILKVLTESGFETPTDIQTAAIPQLLQGHDVIGRSRTGSGKTAAFALPALERIKDGAKGPRVLVLAPTRELAMQVTDAVRTFAKNLPIRVACIYGGASYTPQLRDLRSGAQFIVATPGRLMDHMERGSIDLSGIETLVLDEADEMLRMGFIEAVESILSATPPDRQVCLFSATMPAVIRRVASAHLNEPVEVQVESGGLTTDHIEQRWMMVPVRERLETLARLLDAEERGTTLVFARTRRDCGELAESLGRYGIVAEALHGALNQSARERVLQRMRARQIDIVVATDVAARGIDVEHITHVINVHLPTDVETYVHRIGRTGRAGRKGTAISFATHGERRRIQNYERALKVGITLCARPTKRDIAIRRRGLLARRLEGARSGDLGDVTTWLAGLTEQGWTDVELAAAAVQLLSEVVGIDLGPLPAKEERPAYREPRAREPRFASNQGPRQGSQDRQGPRHGSQDRPRGGDNNTNFDAVNEVQIILFTGAQYHVRPGDLVGAIANEFDIPGSSIGRVSIHDRKSFVGLPRAVADKALAQRDSLVVRGRPVRIALARGQNDGAPPHRPARGGEGPYRGGDDRPRREGENRPRSNASEGPPRRSSGGRDERPRPYASEGPPRRSPRSGDERPHPYASEGPPRRPARGGDAPAKAKAKAKVKAKAKAKAKAKLKGKGKIKAKAKGRAHRAAAA
jgi:ATP-dependent RNA helicase DeaD